MRIVRLVLLGALAYLVSILFLFPASPLIKHIQPQLQPVVLSGIEGKLLAGSVNRISYDDDVFPVELTDVSWKILPQKLLSAALGVNFSFKAYGGLGDGDFEQRYNGDMNLLDVNFTGPAKGLEPLLPLPIATFSGQLAIQVEVAEIRERLLSRMIAQVNWSNAVLQTPMAANFGNLVLNIAAIDEQTHRARLEARGGDVNVDGSIDLLKNGDFSTDIRIEPRSDAPAELLNALRGLGRPDSKGHYRIQRKGNVYRLM